MTADVTISLLLPIEFTGVTGKDEKDLIVNALIALKDQIEKVDYRRLTSTDALKYELTFKDPAGKIADYEVYHDRDQINLICEEIIDGADRFDVDEEFSKAEIRPKSTSTGDFNAPKLPLC